MIRLLNYTDLHFFHFYSNGRLSARWKYFRRRGENWQNVLLAQMFLFWLAARGRQPKRRSSSPVYLLRTLLHLNISAATANVKSFSPFSMADLPADIDTPGFINWHGKPLLCAGGIWNVDYRTQCYVYENNQWNVVAHLTTARRFASTAELSADSFIVMGGNIYFL